MTLTINDDSMSSDRTGHTARPVPGHRQAWVVSWLPGHHLDRNSAITAMVIADVSGPGGLDRGHRLWPHVEGWAAELGLTARTALGAIAAEPPPRAPSAGKDTWAEPADPEAGG
jgi:hypothetical protein